MKKIKTEEVNLPIIKLYLDDLKKIISLLEEGGYQIEIRTECFLYNSINELTANNEEKESLHQVMITAKSTKESLDFLDIKLYPYTSELFFTDSVINHGIVVEIKKTVLKNKNFLRYIFPIDFHRLGIFLWFLLFLMILPYLIRITDISKKITLYFYIIITTYYLLSVFTCWKFHSTITLKNKKDVLNLFRRYRNEILIGTLSAIVGTFIGGILVHLFY